jgi:ankyrin repeat protein
MRVVEKGDRTMKIDQVFPDDGARQAIEQACRGNTVAVRDAIAQGWDVNAPGEGGITPLIYALSQTSVSGVRTLLAAGADPNRPMEGGHTAASLATRLEDPAFLKILLEHGVDPNTRVNDRPLSFTAAGQGRWANVRLLLDSGADINALSENGDTMAMEAAFVGEYDVLLKLLKAGADAKIPAAGGATVAGVIGRARPEPNSTPGILHRRVIDELRARGVRVEEPEQPAGQ